jgi:hypothetical protein
MTTKSDFSEDDWSRIVRAPLVAGLAIALADPGGPIDAAKESMATLKAATNPASREQLVTEVALDIQAKVQQKQNPLKGYRFSTEGEAPSGEQVLIELEAVQAIVAARATPKETAATERGFAHLHTVSDACGGVYVRKTARAAPTRCRRRSPASRRPSARRGRAPTAPGP